MIETPLSKQGTREHREVLAFLTQQCVATRVIETVDPEQVTILIRYKHDKGTWLYRSVTEIGGERLYSLEKL